jgi:hypothetical protein
MRSSDSRPYLSTLVSFKLYPHTTGWSKKLIADTQPVGYVVVL